MNHFTYLQSEFGLLLNSRFYKTLQNETLKIDQSMNRQFLRHVIWGYENKNKNDLKILSSIEDMTRTFFSWLKIWWSIYQLWIIPLMSQLFQLTKKMYCSAIVAQSHMEDNVLNRYFPTCSDWHAKICYLGVSCTIINNFIGSWFI